MTVDLGLKRPVHHVYRIRYRQAGGHVHCRLFSKPEGQATWAKCGDLVLATVEWPSLRAAFTAEFLEEGKND